MRHCRRVCGHQGRGTAGGFHWERRGDSAAPECEREGDVEGKWGREERDDSHQRSVHDLLRPQKWVLC